MADDPMNVSLTEKNDCNVVILSPMENNFELDSEAVIYNFVPEGYSLEKIVNHKPNVNGIDIYQVSLSKCIWVTKDVLNDKPEILDQYIQQKIEFNALEQIEIVHENNENSSTMPISNDFVMEQKHNVTMATRKEYPRRSFKLIKEASKTPRGKENGGIRKRQTKDICCSVCDIPFSNNNEFYKHIHEIHEGVNVNLKCQVCYKMFKSKNVLKAHEAIHSEESPFQCDYCGKRFKLRKRVNEHIKSFHGNYFCTDCGITYERLTEYKIHMVTKHPDKTPKQSYKCEYTHCDAVFLNQSTLTNHVKAHSNERPYGCERCPKRFKHKKHLNVHNRSNCGSGSRYPKLTAKRLQCKFCPKSFTDQGDHRMHERIHDGTNPHYCAQCDKFFLKRAKLLVHLATHNKETTEAKKTMVGGRLTYHCSECDKVFLDKRNYIMHERIHLGTNPHHCKECNHYFLKKRHLDNHNISHHSKDAPYKCNKCDKGFKFRIALERHKNTHERQMSGVGNYHCTSCDTSFMLFSKLKAHLRESSNCFSVECDICGQRFLREKQLQRHKILHTNEKPFTCDTCPKVFAFAWDLKKHERVHCKDMQFQCDKCTKSFVEKRDLKEHEQWHLTGKFSNQCHLCSRSFKRKTKLMIHIKSVHHKLKEFACLTCGKEFARKHDLKKHEELHSKENENGLLSCMICKQKGFSEESLAIHQYSHMRVESSPKTLNFDQLFQMNKNLGLTEQETEPEREVEVEVSINPLNPSSGLFMNVTNEIAFEVDDVIAPRDNKYKSQQEEANNSKAIINENHEIIQSNRDVDNIGNRIELHFNNDDQTITITEIVANEEQDSQQQINLESIIPSNSENITDQGNQQEITSGGEPTEQIVYAATQNAAEVAYLSEIAARYNEMAEHLSQQEIVDQTTVETFQQLTNELSQAQQVIADQQQQQQQGEVQSSVVTAVVDAQPEQHQQQYLQNVESLLLHASNLSNLHNTNYQG